MFSKKLCDNLHLRIKKVYFNQIFILFSGGIVSLTIIIVILIVFIIIFFIILLFRSLKKRVLLSRAEDEILKGENKIAEKKLLEVLQEDPENWEAIKNLSLLYLKNKSYHQALKYLEKALSVPNVLSNWNQSEILFSAGLAAKNLKKYQLAIKYFLMAAGMNSNDPEALKQIAMTYFALEQYDKADTYFKKCYALRDSTKFEKEFIKSFGINCYFLLKYSDSEKLLNSYIQKYPGDVEALAYYGLDLYYLDKKEESIQYLKYGVQLPKTRAESFFLLGEIFFEKQDFDSALAFYLKASQTRNCPKELYLSSLYSIAQIYVNLNKINDAVSYWNKIYEVNPRYRDVSEKISTFSALTSDARIRQFSLANRNDATNICKKIVINTIGQSTITDIEYQDDSMIDFLVSKSKGSKMMVILFRFIRNTDKIGEITVKEFYLKMKEKQASRGIIFSIGILSEAARDFIALRPIEYFDRSELSRVLQKIL